MNILERKELLYYLLFTEGDEKLFKDREDFVKKLDLSDKELLEIKMCAVTTRTLISYVDYSIEEISKRNHEVSSILEDSSRQIALILGNKEQLYEKWMMEWWDDEKKYRMNFILPKASSNVSVYATQFNADTSNEVALPDKYLKFSTRGLATLIPAHLRQYYNGVFTVNVTFGKNSISSIPVNDVGPWNENDNYWDNLITSNKRRTFTDLSHYMPEAYAAFYNDYNDGKCEFGWNVTNPAGIDLCMTVAKLLGFSTNGSGFVNVNMSKLP